MDQPLVSIVIDNYNYAPYLKAAIDSALSQTYPNVEVIVVDDGSTDSSHEIIRSYGNKIIPVLKSNGGQASAFNAGFKVSHGEIICFLDSDDLFLPFKVQEIVKAFTVLKDIDWVFHLPYDVETNDMEERYKSLIECESLEATYLEIDFRDQLRCGKQPRFIPQTSSLSFSRRVFEKVFPLPEDQKTYVGDSYTAMSCVAQGKGCFINKKLSIYRFHENNAFSSTEIQKARETFSKTYIVTSYYLRVNFPYLSRYTNVIFPKGLACFWLLDKPDERYRKFIKSYFSCLSMPEKTLVFLKSLYYCQKTLLRKTLP